MTHGELFAGIGGFGLAAHWAGLETLWANEIDPFAIKVLKKNFPNTKIYEEDIKKIGKHNLPRVDVLSGGFPCQPFSQAGRREGKDDTRYLWPEMLRVIRELQPTYVIGENVAGLLSMENGETLKRILSDLEDEGYHNEVFLIPACAKGAWHRRDRIWIVCYTKHNGPSHGHKEARGKDARGKGGMCEPEGAGTQPQDATSSSSNTESKGGECRNPRIKGFNSQCKKRVSGRNGAGGKDAPNTDTNPIQGMEQEPQQGRHQRQIGLHSGKTEQCPRSTEPSLGGVADGVSSRVDRYWDHEPEGVPRVAKGVKDRVGRLKGLGTALVPAVAYEIFKSIIKHYEERR